MYHHKSWGCTTTNLFGVLHKSHIFPHRAPSGAGVGISRLRPSMESYGPPAVLLQLYPVCFCFCFQLHSIILQLYPVRFCFFAFNCGNYGPPAVSLQLHPVRFWFCIFNCGNYGLPAVVLEQYPIRFCYCIWQGFSYYCQFSPKNLQISKWS